MRVLLERYWATIAGFSLIAGCVAIGVGQIGASTVDGILETSLQRRGEQFAGYLSSRSDAADALITGLSRDPDIETRVRNLATVSGIGGFAIFDAAGRETFRTRSDRYEWLIRDRAGGITSDNRLSPAIVSRPDDFAVVGDAPNGLSRVVAPISRDGRRVGFVSVDVDPAAERGGYAMAFAGATAKIFGVLLVATGVPLLVYIRRKHKIAEAVARIEFLANHDPLTRLLNRRRLQEEVDKLVAAARITREDISYWCLDIDGLTEINDTLGSAHGDELLKVVANRLDSMVAANGLVARIAADDFAICLRRIGDDEEMAAFAARLCAAVAEPVELKGTLVRPKLSIGIARMPRDGRTQAELARHAQIALAHHQTNGGGDFVAFEPQMDEIADRRRRIEALIVRALETDAFELFYQPLVSGDGLRIVGFEALIRLRDESGTFVSPAVFVPVAETRGYIKDIGTRVIREAARQAARWPDDIVVSVNLSAVQFRDGDLVGIVADALRDAGIPGRRLELEVVETLLLDGTDAVIAQLVELKQLGVTIAMDDFGTGYSSLSYLWKFPFDKLKIDQSFMVALDEQRANVAEVIGTIISLAHLMRMKVTTEGVETAAQAALLAELGCDIIQGYHFGKPMPPEEAAAELFGRFAERLAARSGARLPRPAALTT